MLQIRPGKDGGVELSDRDKNLIVANKQISLGEDTFTTPGEYEVEGVEIVYGTSSALIVWEKLQIVVIFALEKPTSFEKSQFSPCNVLIIDGDITAIDKPKATELLEAFDPSIGIFGHNVNMSEIQDALKVEDRDLLKLTEATLPTEGRELYRLIG